MPTIDLSFELVGQTIPLDHGYALFGALSRIVPALHNNRRLGVHPIRGRQVAPGVMALTESSRLRLRMPSEEIAAYVELAGKRLDLDGHHLRVGIPRVESLIPAPRLACRVVTIRNALDAESVLNAVRRELESLEIEADPSLVPTRRPGWEGHPLRRVLRVKNKRVIGYALQVAGLTADSSVRLQEFGLGGRRRMGCGVFVPVSETHAK
jgi:CRISPR-associated protein Cas6